MMCTNEKTVEPRVHYAPLMTGRTLCPVIDANRKTGDIEQATCPECRELYFQDITFGECVPYRQKELKQALKGGRIESFSVLANKWKRLPAWVDGETIELLGNLRYRIAVREREEPTKCEHCDGLLVRPTRVKGFRIGTCEDCGVGGLHVCNDYNLCRNCFDNQLCDDLVYEEAGACQKPADKVTPQPQEAVEESNKHYAEYVFVDGREQIILKDGHTMFLSDVVKDLNRKSYLEEQIASQAAQIEELNTEKTTLLDLCDEYSEKRNEDEREINTLKAKCEKLKAFINPITPHDFNIDTDNHRWIGPGETYWCVPTMEWKTRKASSDPVYALTRTPKPQPEPEYLAPTVELAELRPNVYSSRGGALLGKLLAVDRDEMIHILSEEGEVYHRIIDDAIVRRADLNKLTKEKEG